LDKVYQPSKFEAVIYGLWEDSDSFRCGLSDGADTYSIVIPPPNVTGSLHMGHALNNTLQDILVRRARMSGHDTLWQPGTDHAGIATQMVVERQLDEIGLNRREMGRESFIERVWEWKSESGGNILRQLQRLGATCDWSRERFTMDEGLSKAVTKVFVELYKEGLIYKDKRLVNWDPKLLTAISDLEVENREVNGNAWHISYPVAGDKGTSIVVMTTRPETMLGDSAIAVHPDDTRYHRLIGKFAELPLVGRQIPIIGDEHADPEYGSGAVKITPGHDFNDFEVGKRHGLDIVNIFDMHAHVADVDHVPEVYRGLERFEARKAVLSDLEELGLVEGVEEIAHTLPFGDRSGVIIEPWLTDQWYVDASTLAKPAIEAVENGDVVFVPRQWQNTYFEWMRNIQPWCISRQLWWGHRIPAWYGPDKKVFVEMTEAEAKHAAEVHYGSATELIQDDDVLDTWFSSQLWPFSTLGWPEHSGDLKKYYPTDVLVTGFDIIFFWVARMIMSGIHFMGQVPFHTVYVHALVRDSRGQKMSKSKGNVIDPIEMIDKYGADALRFTLCAMAAPGRDIKLSPSRVEGYRNFATKLWNAARFCKMNDCRWLGDEELRACDETVNRWMVSATFRTINDVDSAINAYRFNDAAELLYHFVWGTFCDWYIELSKPVIQGPDGPSKQETQAVCGWMVNIILRLLHPIMPFITEKLWEDFSTTGEGMLIRAKWPESQNYMLDVEAEKEINWVVELVSQIRSVRSEVRVPSNAVIPAIYVEGANDSTVLWVRTHETRIKTLARVGEIQLNRSAPASGAIHLVLDEVTVTMPLADLVDVREEQIRLKREIEKKDDEIRDLGRKLENGEFLARAPQNVVEQQRQRYAEAKQIREKLESALGRIHSAV